MPDLFDFFKENEAKLHERPSEEVWQKLEKRLEKSRYRRERRRGIRFLQLGVVTLVLLLLLLAAVLVWYYVRQSGH